MSSIDVNRLILTGENPFIRLSQNDGDDNTTNANFWRILLSPAGPGHLESAEFSATFWRLVTCAHSRRATVR